MIKKFIKGNALNPEGVIKALEELGGINKYNRVGSDGDTIYFINKNNDIDSTIIGCPSADIIMECFEEIQPSAPKVITNLDIAKWYFKMIREGHAVQLIDGDDGCVYNNAWFYYRDGEETDIKKVRIDFGEWIPIEEAGILTDKETPSDNMDKVIASLKSK